MPYSVDWTAVNSSSFVCFPSVSAMIRNDEFDRIFWPLSGNKLKICNLLCFFFFSFVYLFIFFGIIMIMFVRFFVLFCFVFCFWAHILISSLFLCMWNFLAWYKHSLSSSTASTLRKCCALGCWHGRFCQLNCIVYQCEPNTKSYMWIWWTGGESNKKMSLLEMIRCALIKDWGVCIWFAGICVCMCALDVWESFLWSFVERNEVIRLLPEPRNTHAYLRNRQKQSMLFSNGRRHINIS